MFQESAPVSVLLWWDYLPKLKTYRTRNVGDKEAGKRDGVVGVGSIEDRLLQTLESGVGQISSVEVCREVQ